MVAFILILLHDNVLCLQGSVASSRNHRIS